MKRSGQIVAFTLTGLVCVLVLAAAAVASLLGLATWQRHTGYFGPAFTPDGRFVYAVVRETDGITWGFGWEHFTPPAWAYPLSDRLSLVRIDVASANRQTLETWATTPVSRRVIREYRGRVFNTMSATVRPGPDRVDYVISMSIPKVPFSEIHTIEGAWSETGTARRRGDWRAGGWGGTGLSEPLVAGTQEVFTLPGVEFFPCAIVILDHAARASRPLTWTRDCSTRYPQGPVADDLLAVSRKPDIDRIAELERVRTARIAKHRAEGASESEAILRVNRELEDRGLLPRSPRMTARAIDGRSLSLPTFEIADAEMQSGVFPDIERAIADPGLEIDKSMGRYIVHRDYTTSARLNALLEGGAREFAVRFRGGTYHIEIR